VIDDWCMRAHEHMTWHASADAHLKGELQSVHRAWCRAECITADMTVFLAIRPCILDNSWLPSPASHTARQACRLRHDTVP